MESTAAKSAPDAALNPAAIVPSERHLPPPAHGATGVAAAPLTERKTVGYGLPCSHCHAYYPADMKSCPICKSTERVSPTAPVAHTMTAPTPKPASDEAIDAERERFLKELKSHAFASHTQIDTAATFRCVLGHQHSGATEPAAVCNSCYGEVRQQADRMEAALRIDPREAAKIVYDAVWADTSNPNNTYLNAAKALLGEMQKRAGMGMMHGTYQPLAH